jgi:NADH-quinone oxidoreductase subunit L
MTAFYSCRLMFMTFFGKPHDHHHYDHAHESPPVMLIPLYVLAIGAVVAGFVAYGIFVGDGWEAFWRGAIAMESSKEALHHAHEVPALVKVLPLVMGLAGIALSWWFYVGSKGLPQMMARTFAPLYRLFYNKWYFDELYDAIFVRPAMWLGGHFWKKGDVGIIDGIGPNGMAAGASRLSAILGRVQSGYLYHYAFAMLIGVALLVTWYMLSRGR